MTGETCDVLMSRVPVDRYGRREDHASMQLCGRPVERDGLCAFHVRRRDSDPDLARTVRIARLGRR